ncbi:MAG: hypothetical protein ACJAYF_003586 [Arenicella sp.]|jgi:hypothetical protein
MIFRPISHTTLLRIHAPMAHPHPVGKKKGATNVAPKPPKEDGGVVQADFYYKKSNLLTGYQIGAEASLT